MITRGLECLRDDTKLLISLRLFLSRVISRSKNKDAYTSTNTLRVSRDENEASRSSHIFHRDAFQLSQLVANRLKSNRDKKQRTDL